MLISLATLLATLFSIFRSRAAVQLENLALRHQIGVLRRSARERPKLTSGDLSLARIKSAFEMSNIQRGLVTCYMDDISAVAEFWRRTGDRCRERFTIKSWCLRRRDSATRERTPPGPSNRAKVAIKWMNRTNRLRIAES